MTTRQSPEEELKKKLWSILYPDFPEGKDLAKYETRINRVMQLIASQRQEAGESIERRALEWLLSSDTGVSSKTLCAHMLGIEYKGHFLGSPPSDASDRGRCIRLLQNLPEWIDRLDEMAELEGQTSFVIDRKGMRQEHNSWRKQIPLIRQEMQAPSGRKNI